MERQNVMQLEYNKYKEALSSISQKIGELETEADEHK
jgi:hypothetical protein